MPPSAATVRRRPGRPAAPQQTEQRREQILCAAMRSFARTGYHDTDLQALADELGIGKGTVYRYFPTKEKLFLAAAQRVLELMRAEIDAATAGVTDPLDTIPRAVEAYLRFFDAHPHFVEIVMLERAIFGGERTPTYVVHRAANAARWNSLYSELMDAGRIRRMKPEALREVVGSALYGTMFMNYFAGRKTSLKTQVDRIVTVIFEGVLTPSERSARARRRAASGNPS